MITARTEVFCILDPGSVQQSVCESSRPQKAQKDTRLHRNLVSWFIFLSIFQGCDLLGDGTGSYSFWDDLKLKIEPVDMHHSGNYTCTLNFTLDGFTGSVSESITAWVSGQNETCERCFFIHPTTGEHRHRGHSSLTRDPSSFKTITNWSPRQT